MTTLAIIGTGIVGRSLLYNLKSHPQKFDKITLFTSENFAFPCTLHSTAIAAPRGVTKGHSALGDLISDGFREFREHVETENPFGVWKITQWTGATEKLSEFSKRYPSAREEKFLMKEKVLMVTEEAYMIDPAGYGNWLVECCSSLPFQLEHDFVVSIERTDKFKLTTQNGKSLFFDEVVFAGGNYNRFWKSLAPSGSLETSRPVAGSYLEFNHVSFGHDSFSLTLDGDNLIWNLPRQQLLIGSSSEETNVVLPAAVELKDIYQRLKSAVTIDLPAFEAGAIKTGLREKAKKREPYVISKDRMHFIGGLYKNGFSLSMKLTRDLVARL